MIYSTKQYPVLLELHITQRQLDSPGRQNAAQLTIWNKALCYCTVTRTQCVPILFKEDRIFFFLTNSERPVAARFFKLRKRSVSSHERVSQRASSGTTSDSNKIESLSTRVFETRTATGREHFASHDSGVS